MRIYYLSKALCTAVVALVLACPLALAQQWPVKPVRIIVPLPPGQAADIISRLLAEKMSPGLGQQVIIDNRPGSGTMIGSELAARSAPDGYTYLAGGSSALTINPFLYSKLAYDTVRDFAPVTQMVSIAFVLCVNLSLPAHNVRELVKLAKSKPGEMTYGTSGNGSTNHIALSLFGSRAGINITHVPYKGAAPSLVDLMSGQVSMVAETTPAVLPLIKANKIRPVGVLSLKRIPFLPDVPSFDEQGIKGYDITTWTSIVAPAGVPAPILDRMNAELVKAIKTTDIQQRLTEMGFVGVGSAREEFGAFLRSELAKWKEAVKISGAHIE
jgi:tripartite-type tricarboxylate transporter receptor subunit TctC